jgi:RHS repeat-associated protein
LQRAPRDFQWRMLHDGVGWFGSSTTNVAVDVQAQNSLLNYIQVDHLNTPRLVTDSSGTIVWRWDQQEPFGVNTPDENPSSLGMFEFPLRFPGQYADKETSLFYNYYRDLDSTIGRYTESDPIGLRGGLNTFGYVDADPLRFKDFFGLQQDTFVKNVAAMFNIDLPPTTPPSVPGDPAAIAAAWKLRGPAVV